MLAKRIIPCLDVTGGRVVKGVNFVGLRDAGDPVELAERYNAQGADELVFLDITASSDARAIMADVVARTARRVFIPLTVGGGIRNVEDARNILLSGADKVSVNTAAVRRPELIRELSEEFGAQAVVLAIDARRSGNARWNVYTKGGRVDEGIDAIEWAHRAKRWSGRNPAHFDGYRWRADRLRLRTHARRRKSNFCSGDCVGRSRSAIRFCRSADQRLRGCRASGLRVPLWKIHGRRPQGRAAQRPCAGAAHLKHP